jgi:pimeloyl-ACP methyl ester carboxylesterase
MIEARDASLYCRIYGPSAQPLVIVHGGPGMPGSAAGLGRLLEDSWRVVEYHQRGAGRTRSTGPLTVGAHVEDLRAVVRGTCGEREPVLIGVSWGAILALSFSASHPGWVRKTVLVGCSDLGTKIGGSLTPEQRKRVGGRAARKAEKLLKTLLAGGEGADEAFADVFRLLFPLYRCSPETPVPDLTGLSFAAYRETMGDAVRLFESGALFSDWGEIRIPVVALHGDHDPNTPSAVRAMLEERLADFRLVLFKNCGHFPWLEPHTQALFLRTLREELAR